MKKSELTVRDAMKFARHDFLNELQLILMHMDLNNVPEARRKLLEATERMRNESQLSGLDMPALETWMLTFDWNYSVFSKQIKTILVPKKSARKADDQQIVDVLDDVFQQLIKGADPYADCMVNILVTTTSDEWEVSLSLPGQTAPIVWNDVQEKDWTAKLSIDHEYWTFTISGQ
ncbi:Spo0B domain-containing protein [Sporosarcina aquimarina]|uniref:Spo0B domain-containing protein n=1 Tax=Sporosarcina aquimarina TaxID=114975 RepID=UPI00203D957B|nr:Spo0B domain-containing protein [Sporosarcina aquimarina]MCM3758120.1 Spo0B domain-containing protein [Sporosarcina aquimarina]